MEIIFPDFSHWQADVNWPEFDRSGAPAVGLRAGSIDDKTGVPYTDYKWERNTALAPRHLPVLAYWYHRPNHSAVKQADHYSRLLDDLDKSGRKFAIAFDVETTGGLAGPKVTAEADAFSRLVMRRFEGVCGALYTNWNFLKNIFSPVKGLTSLHLWFADPDGFPPLHMPAGWPAMSLYQFTWKGDPRKYGVNPTYSKGVDENRWMKSAEEFRAFFRLDSTKPLPEPDPEPDPKEPFQFTNQMAETLWNWALSQGMKP